jgi:hypothetical protein
LVRQVALGLPESKINGDPGLEGFVVTEDDMVVHRYPAAPPADAFEAASEDASAPGFRGFSYGNFGNF